jgi:hypothetical protein
MSARIGYSPKRSNGVLYGTVRSYAAGQTHYIYWSWVVDIALGHSGNNATTSLAVWCGPLKPMVTLATRYTGLEFC